MNFEDKIFVGVTSHCGRHKPNNWKKQFLEIKKLGIKTISLFPTTLNFENRKEFYKELEKSGVEKIPLVHIRSEDFTEDELNYFITKYKTKWFNCHEKDCDVVYKRFPKHKHLILLETGHSDNLNEKIKPEEVGGICADISHFMKSKEDNNTEYEYIRKNFDKIKANHLNGFDSFRKDTHHLKHKHQLDYIKTLPKKLFSDIIALEMDNSITAQLKFKKYIVKLLNTKFNS